MNEDVEIRIVSSEVARFRCVMLDLVQHLVMFSKIPNRVRNDENCEYLYLTKLRRIVKVQVDMFRFCINLLFLLNAPHGNQWCLHFFSGLLPSRLETEQLSELLFQLPPRLTASLFTNSIIMCIAHNARFDPDKARTLYSLPYFINLHIKMQTKSNFLEPKCFIAFMVRFKRPDDFAILVLKFFKVMDGRL